MPVIGPPQTANPWADPSMKPASVIENPDFGTGLFSHRQSLQGSGGSLKSGSVSYELRRDVRNGSK